MVCEEIAFHTTMESPSPFTSLDILAIAARPITQFVIPGIFLFFVIYYLGAALAQMGTRSDRRRETSPG